MENQALQNFQEIKIKSKSFYYEESIEQCMIKLDKLKQENGVLFEEIQKLGNRIDSLARNEDLEELENLIEYNQDKFPFMRLYIEDAFDSVLALRFNDSIEFFLRHGFDLKETFPQCVINLVKTAKLFPDDPPTETLKLLFDYGANLDQFEKKKYRTALHFSCKYGIYDFVEFLVKNGAQVNPVDLKQNTPMKYAFDKKKENSRFKRIIQFLESKDGVLDWRNPKIF